MGTVFEDAIEEAQLQMQLDTIHVIKKKTGWSDEKVMDLLDVPPERRMRLRPMLEGG